MRRFLLASSLLALALLVPPATATASFGFLPGPEGFEAIARAEGGAPAVLAGSHPYALTIRVGLRLGPPSEGQPGTPFPDGDLRSLRIDTPPGFLFNPAATSTCSLVAFNLPRSSPFEASRSGESCPAGSQVGTVDVHTGFAGGSVWRFGVFNLDPAPGFPAQLGFAPFGSPIVFGLRLRPGADGSYGFSVEADNVPQGLDFHELDLTLWGNPWAAVHDGERGDCLNEAEPGFPWAKCAAGSPRPAPRAYLTMPTDCAGPMSFAATAGSWQQAGEVSATYVESTGGEPVTPRQCGDLLFKPQAFGQLTDHRSTSPSGFSFQLLNTEEGLLEPDGRVRAQVRQAVVQLPAGVTLNPSLGAGLGVCTPAQYAAEAPGSAEGAGCPNASKVGSFTVDSPLFAEKLSGAVYLAQPDDPSTPGAENPFDSMLAVYMVARLPARGILVTAPGRLTPDPDTGRLTATFEDLPELPYTGLEAKFRPGQRSVLVTPSSCGPAPTRIELSPWTPAAPVASTTENQIEAGIAGGPCPGPGAPPFAPRIVAGSVNSNVGSYTPFSLHLTRGDAEQEFTSYSAVLPRGITGRLAGIPVCSDAAIASARGKSGEEETAHPSCPAASQVGRTLSGYGVGSALAYAPGRVYLAGPYHGSPLSLVTIDAATVGPFDLGTVVIRSAFEIDPETAQLRIDSRGSDPIPHILRGIPLHLRDIGVLIDRPQFTRNPTSCEPSQVTSTLTGSGAVFGDSSDDSTVVASSFFQLLNCRALGFRPRLGIRLRGGSRRGDYPALRVTFAARPGDANLKRIAVTMPHSEFFAQNHIRAICTRPDFAAERCPPGSEYGQAVAYTPLFDQPLRGPVYLRSSSGRLPDLVASLRSGAVRIVLVGSIGPARGGIRAFFDNLPDAEVSRFVLRMRGGRRGLIVNSSNICAAPPRATVKALAQNDLGRVFGTRLRGQCRHGKGGRSR